MQARVDKQTNVTLRSVGLAAGLTALPAAAIAALIGYFIHGSAPGMFSGRYERFDGFWFAFAMVFFVVEVIGMTVGVKWKIGDGEKKRDM